MHTWRKMIGNDGRSNRSIGRESEKDEYPYVVSHLKLFELQTYVKKDTLIATAIQIIT